MDPIIQAFYEHLLQNPEDWDTRNQLADYYEDQGELVIAFGQRWQIREKKRPARGSTRNNLYKDFGKWVLQHNTSIWVLPPVIFDSLKGEREDSNTNEKSYDTFREAEVQLALTLKRLQYDTEPVLGSFVEES